MSRSVGSIVGPLCRRRFAPLGVAVFMTMAGLPSAPVVAAGTAAVNESTPAVCYPPLIQGSVDSANLSGLQLVTEPLSSATVELIDGNGQTVRSAATDPGGLYSIAQVSDGTYTLRFSAVGNSSTSRMVTVVSTQT